MDINKMPIKRAMEWKLLPNPYELTQEDIGKLLDFDFGLVQSSDVGRLIYVKNHIIQMESIEQSKNRKEVRHGI